MASKLILLKKVLPFHFAPIDSIIFDLHRDQKGVTAIIFLKASQCGDSTLSILYDGIL